MTPVKRILLAEALIFGVALAVFLVLRASPAQGEDWGGFFLLLIILGFLLPGLAIAVGSIASLSLVRTMRAERREGDSNPWSKARVALLSANLLILSAGLWVYAQHTLKEEFDLFPRYYIDVLYPNSKALLSAGSIEQIVRKGARARKFQVMESWVSEGMDSNQWPGGLPVACEPDQSGHYLQNHARELSAYCLSHFEAALCRPRVVCLKSRSGSNNVNDLWHFRPVDNSGRGPRKSIGERVADYLEQKARQGPKARAAMGEAQRLVALSQLRQLYTAALSYLAMEEGCARDLDALAAEMGLEQTALRDAWGTRFRYSCQFPDTLEFHSAGPDKQFGGRDDLTYPLEGGSSHPLN
jgi:hypothetical protein